MKTLHVDLSERSYDIYIGTQLLHETGSLIRNLYKGTRVAVISDTTVWGLYGSKLLHALRTENFEIHQLLFSPGERTKELDNLKKIYKFFAEISLTRTDMVIAFGGGVIGDITGFAAATYLRGVDYIQIPTTLLAQVDASVGGKTAINLESGKNQVGAFWQPKAVISDISLLSTLNDREFAGGMAEVIKYAAIRSATLFSDISSAQNRTGITNRMEQVIATCCTIKRDIVLADERDIGERMLLNFGHTFGHAIEKLGNYSEFTHGEAVAIGMVLASALGEQLQITETGTAEKIRDMLISYGLPMESDYRPEAMIDLIAHDKKNLNDTINLILLKKIGEGIIFPVEQTKLTDLMRRSGEWLSC